MLAGESPVAEQEMLEPEDRAREMLVLGLRPTSRRRPRGVRRAGGIYNRRTRGAALRGFVERGLLVDNGRTVRLSREGLMVSDALWPKLLRK